MKVRVVFISSTSKNFCHWIKRYGVKKKNKMNISHEGVFIYLGCSSVINLYMQALIAWSLEINFFELLGFIFLWNTIKIDKAILENISKIHRWRYHDIQAQIVNVVDDDIVKCNY